MNWRSVFAFIGVVCVTLFVAAGAMVISTLRRWDDEEAEAWADAVVESAEQIARLAGRDRS